MLTEEGEIREIVLDEADVASEERVDRVWES